MISTSFTTKPRPPLTSGERKWCATRKAKGAFDDRSNLPGTIRTLDDARDSIPIIHGRPCGSSASPLLLLEGAGKCRAGDHFEPMRERKDGTVIPISLISPVKSAAGTTIGVSKIGCDRTVMGRGARHPGQAARRAAQRQPLSSALGTRRALGQACSSG